MEAVVIAWDLLMDLGLKELKLEFNSLVSKEDRVNYRNQLVKWLKQHQNQLDPDSQERLQTNPLRILDSKNPNTQELLKTAPELVTALGAQATVCGAAAPDLYVISQGAMPKGPSGVP